jgi:hypothetical protein
MRAVRLLLRDRGTLLPLVVLLVQLVLLQGGTTVLAAGLTAAGGHLPGWCVGYGPTGGEIEEDNDGTPERPAALCAILCTAAATAGVAPPLVGATVAAEAAAGRGSDESFPAPFPVLSRAPPPRPGATRAPPTA